MRTRGPVGDGRGPLAQHAPRGTPRLGGGLAAPARMRRRSGEVARAAWCRRHGSVRGEGPRPLPAAPSSVTVRGSCPYCVPVRAPPQVLPHLRGWHPAAAARHAGPRGTRSGTGPGAAGAGAAHRRSPPPPGSGSSRRRARPSPAAAPPAPGPSAAAPLWARTGEHAGRARGQPGGQPRGRGPGRAEGLRYEFLVFITKTFFGGEM